jgi:hypothetical protein
MLPLSAAGGRFHCNEALGRYECEDQLGIFTAVDETKISRLPFHMSHFKQGSYPFPNYLLT